MTIRATTRKALTDITRRRGRTLLVVLGIMIGIMGLTMINVASDAINSVFANGNDTHASPDISFSALSVDPALSSSLNTVPNVQAVQIDTHYQTRWHITKEPGHVTITIVSYQNLQAVKLYPFQLTDGRLPGNGEIVMEGSNREMQAFAVGNLATIDTPRGPAHLRIVGIARTSGLPVPLQSGVTQAYMTSTALGQFTGSSAANDIVIKLYDRSRASETARAVATVLQRHHVSIINASIVQGIPAQSVSNSLLSVMRMLTLIALILTGFLIIITVTTLVTEQIGIIGTMKALGGTRLVIMRGYLLSIIIYGLLGTLPGIVLGLGAGYELAAFMLNLFTKDPGPLQITPSSIVPSMVAGLGVPLIAALLPLWNGTRISAREAITAYGVNAVRATSSNGGRSRLLWVPQTVWLGIRGIFRQHGRAILTLLALTLAGTVFLAVQTTISSFDQFAIQFSGLYNDDAMVTLATPQPYERIRQTALAVANMAHIERVERSRVNTRWGLMELTGVEANTQIYVKHLIAGRWFTSNETHVLVINQIVANKSGLKVGDTLTFSNALNRESWRIIGEVNDPTDPVDFGIGLTPVSNYYAFTGLSPQLVQGFMVQGKDRSPQAVDLMASQLDATLSRRGVAPTTETAQEKLAFSENEFALVDTLFYAAGAIVAIIGILGVVNTLTASVLERRREIGVLRSLGAKHWQVGAVFGLEGLALALIAWGIGVLLGIPGAYGFVSLLSAIFIQLPFAFNPLMLLSMLGFIIAITLLASCLPVLRATRVRVADTLHYE